MNAAGAFGGGDALNTVDTGFGFESFVRVEVPISLGFTVDLDDSKVEGFDFEA